MEEPVTASMWELAQDSDGCLRVEPERTLAEQALTSANGPSRKSDNVRFRAAVGGQADIECAVAELPDL
jgi:hypothetical protein